MIALLTSIHVLICLCLIVVVLLQAGKGAGMAGVFGASSGGGQQFFGGRGAAGFLGKLTAALAIMFMVTSITLTLMGSVGGRSSHSVVREAAEDVQPSPGGAVVPPTVPATEIPTGLEESPPAAPSGGEVGTEGGAAGTPGEGPPPGP